MSTAALKKKNEVGVVPAQQQNSLEVTKLAERIEQVLMTGDLTALNAVERVEYHNRVCESIGINPLTRPFEYTKLNGKTVLYARKDCTDQLRKIYDVSLTIPKRELIGDIYIVTAQAKLPNGRTDESIGAVAIKSKQGEELANAYMKAETKAKRRVTLSVCGLGMLDETEASDATLPADLPAGVEGTKPEKEARRSKETQVETAVTGLSSQGGTTNNRKWTLYMITTPEGPFATFSSTHYTVAEEAHKTGQTVLITYTEGERGRQISEIAIENVANTGTAPTYVEAETSEPNEPATDNRQPTTQTTDAPEKPERPEKLAQFISDMKDVGITEEMVEAKYLVDDITKLTSDDKKALSKIVKAIGAGDAKLEDHFEDLPF